MNSPLANSSQQHLDQRPEDNGQVQGGGGGDPLRRFFERSDEDESTHQERRPLVPDAAAAAARSAWLASSSSFKPHRNVGSVPLHSVAAASAAAATGGRGASPLSSLTPAAAGSVGVNPAVYYDPYSPVDVKVSLLDHEDDDEDDNAGGGKNEESDEAEEDDVLPTTRPIRNGDPSSPFVANSHAHRSPRTMMLAAAGTAGLLEMEDPDQKEDPSDDNDDEEQEVVFENVVDAGGRRNDGLDAFMLSEPIQTNSGLLLTHRRNPGEEVSAGTTDSSSRVRSRHGSSSAYASSQSGRLEVEHEYTYHPHRVGPNSANAGGPYRPSTLFPSHAGRGGGGGGSHPHHNLFTMPSILPLQRWLSFARLWVVVSAAFLMLGMTVVVHHMRHESASSQPASDAAAAHRTSTEGSANARVVSINQQPEGSYPADRNSYPDQIILLPLPEGYAPHHQQLHHGHHRNLLLDPEDHGLHQLFVQWKETHDKAYSSHEEHAKRFHIWRKNHKRIQRRNEAHGPCRLTSQPVFGTNHLSDLTEEEFQQRYLSGYGLPREVSDPAASQHDHAPPVLDPEAGAGANLHARRRRTQQSMRTSVTSRRRTKDTWYEPAKQTSIESCDWYDVSCILRYIFETYFYGLGRTMEPIYDADSYPLMVDWRAVGAVTDVHSQGSCGACWAITAVETVESAHYLSTDTLVDLSEAEVVVCTEDTEWCSGGWPQSAFEYIINQKGIPLESDLPYNADYLLSLTEAREAGDSDGTVKAYMQSICPSGKGGGGGGGHSGDNKNNQNSGGGSSFTRYGSIKGYGYATEKCVCYSDGSGCDCDSQNEGLAVRNVATYGPAVVCVDASTWQDYKGGIMTAESGCSSKFLDVNHCVQVVGYAFATSDDSNNEQQKNSHSGSGDRGGSKDNSDRIGYWIVRNQWSTYWGMSGFAYVAMGENTCGILNDMIQVYT